MSSYLKIVLKSIKSLLGDFRIKVDREKQLVTIVQGVRVTTLTYEQVIEEIEKLFNESE